MDIVGNLRDLRRADAGISDVPWHRGPGTRLVRRQDGSKYVATPFDVEDKSVRYRPVRHYRDLAADFLRIETADDAVSFVTKWGALRLDNLHAASARELHGTLRVSYIRQARVEAGHSLARGTLYDRVDDVLGWADDARDLANRIWKPAATDREMQGAYNLTTAVLRSMGLVFAWGSRRMSIGIYERSHAVEPRIELEPRTLLHVMYWALLRGIQGVEPPFICRGWPGNGCRGTVPPYSGRGRPPVYCTRSCSDRVRERRRARASV